MIDDEEAREFLEDLVKHTDLLRRNEDGYVFEKQRFVEYLAGERIDVDALARAFLTGMDLDKIENFRQPITIAYALRIQHRLPDMAATILTALVDRANGTIARSQELTPTEINNAFDWLSIALECASSALDTGASQSLSSMSQSAIRLLNQHRYVLMPNKRAEAINQLLRTCRRSKPSETLDEVERLLQQIDDVAHSRWVDFAMPNQEPDQKPVEIQIERTPVLVCEFEEFLDEIKRNARWKDDPIWDHAPKDRLDLLTSTAVLGEDDATLESWRKQRVNLGNPIVFVTWYEAVAYARWLTNKLRDKNFISGHQRVRLPTVHEVQQVLPYISGGKKEPWDGNLGEGPATKVNHRGAGIDDVSPPGTFRPAYNLLDFGSNTQMWTAPVDADGQVRWPPTNDTSKDHSVIGAAWTGNLLDLQTSLPIERPPDERNAGRGIRVILEPEAQ